MTAHYTVGIRVISWNPGAASASIAQQRQENPPGQQSKAATTFQVLLLHAINAHSDSNDPEPPRSRLTNLTGVRCDPNASVAAMLTTDSLQPTHVSRTAVGDSPSGSLISKAKSAKYFGDDFLWRREGIVPVLPTLVLSTWLCVLV